MISVMYHLGGKKLNVSVDRKKTKAGEPYIVLSFKSNSDYIDLFMTEEQLYKMIDHLELALRAINKDIREEINESCGK